MFRSASIFLPAAALAISSSACDQDRDRIAEDPAGAPQEQAVASAEMPKRDLAAVGDTAGAATEGAGNETPDAVADLNSAEDQEIDGKIKFYDTGAGVRVVAQVEKANPGKHGIHVHEKGDCSNIKGESMGGHFSPEGHMHALPGEDPARHLGDLGNIDIGSGNTGRLDITVKDANLKENDKMSFLGRSVVIHGSVDSGKSKQPSGDSGPPIACGVIEKN